MLASRGDPNYGKVRPIVDTNRKQFLSVYDIAIDEAMIAFKGRLPMKLCSQKAKKAWFQGMGEGRRSNRICMM